MLLTQAYSIAASFMKTLGLPNRASPSTMPHEIVQVCSSEHKLLVKII
jgi:hypothetical protein